MLVLNLKDKEKLCKIFKKHGLNITIECNLWITNFQDVTSNLGTRKHYPHRKVNNELLYIHEQSNHPSITKEIPAMINKRISNISCDKECFDKAAPDYNNTLQNSGFNKNINFTPRPPQRKKLLTSILLYQRTF